jgi:hypothetical protein
MDAQEKYKVARKVLVHLMEIRHKIYEIQDEFNPDDFEELADQIIEVDLATEKAIYWCEVL